MNIGQAADRSGVAAKTIRYYESVGLVEAAARRGNGYRSYGGAEIETLKFVNRARGLGFSVEDCRNLLALYRDRKRASAEVKAVALDHISSIDLKIAELQGMRATLAELADKCHGDERPDCPILDDLAGLNR